MLRDWGVFLLIMVAGAVTGFLTWVASQPAQVCHHDCGITAYYKGVQGTQAGP
jgi:hypothetical protein